MSSSSPVIIRILFSLFCLVSSTSAFANGALRVSDGINVSTRFASLGDAVDINFTLRETENTPVSSVNVRIIMRNIRGGPNILVRDFGRFSALGYSSFAAGESKVLGIQGESLVRKFDLQNGTYAMAVVYVNDDGELMVFDDENGANSILTLEVSRTLLGFEGYVFRRTDLPEYRWVGRLPNGEFGHTWISEECAVSLGGEKQKGDWFQLSTYEAPAGDLVIDNPCSNGSISTNNVKLNGGIEINPPRPSVGDRFEVIFDLNEREYRPARYSNVQVSIENAEHSATVDLGEIAFDAVGSRSFTAVFDASHQLEAGTYEAVVRYQILDGPLINFETRNAGSNPWVFQIQNTELPTEGFVFSRTDSSELRWVEQVPTGEFGHIWIDDQCAQWLGGVSRSGTWDDLTNLAPAGDQSIDSPCPLSYPVPENPITTNTEGYVFSRSDTDEFRWIAPTSSGLSGHTWISSDCAVTLGGEVVSGDWSELNNLAPAGDKTVSNPCDAIPIVAPSSESYVFARTDASELRWVARSPNGEFGHIWIDEQCAQSLGGASVEGNWRELERRAPAGDLSIMRPC